MALYQLTMFYPNVRQHAATLRQIRADVETLAGKNWRLLSAGEQAGAIVFETDVPPERIRAVLGSFDGIEQFQFLLVQVSGTVAGYLSQDAWKWLARHQV